MRIHRLRVRDFRGIGEAHVELAPTGVTIIEGDNEAGKTSLADALDLVLTVRDDSKKASVKALQPYGRDVGPEVEVELSTGPYRLVLRKRWLRRPETHLRILAPVAEELTGREAHDRVGEILAETLDVGLWQTLRVTQGSDPGAAAFDVPSLGRALDAAVGADAGGDREDQLWDRIVAERDRYWTATGRPSAERERLARRLAEAEEAVRAAEDALREMESEVDELARLEREAQDLVARQRDLEEQAATAAAKAREVDELRSELEREQAQLRALTAERQQAEQQAAARIQLIDAVVAGTQRLEEAEAALAAAAPEKAAALARHDEARAVRDAAARAADAAAEAAHRARADLDHRRRQIEVAQLRERHDRVVQHLAARAQAEAVLARTEVDDAVVAEIEAAHLDVVRAEAAAQAGAATVSLRSLGSAEVRVDGRPVPLTADEPTELTVLGSAAVEVPGAVHLEIRPGAEAVALAERLEAARAELAARCERAGVADLAAARAAAAERAAAAQTCEDLQQRIRDDLRDLSVEDLAGKVRGLTARLEEYASARPADPPMPACFEAAKAAAVAAEDELVAARAALGAAEDALQQAALAAREAEVAGASLHERVNLARSSLEVAETALAGARSERSDDEVRDALAAAVEAHERASERVALAERALGRLDPDTVDALRENAVAAVERGRAQLAANLKARQHLEAVLQTKGEQGLAQRLDAATTERVRLQLERERLEARAEAARLLHDTFEARRAEAHARYVAPFTEEIERLGRVVFGPTFEVELDADLRIAARRLDGVRLPVEQLSTGAREQLGIIARLACASIVAGDGAPVLLDDTLGWTDPRRLEHMGAAISLAGRDCQIVLLTCTPGRFAAVGQATTIRLGPGGTAPAGRAASA